VSGAEPDLAAFGGVKAGALCLDVGAGKGRAAKPLLAAGARVVLLDRDGARLADAAADLRGPASFVRGDARSLPFAAGVFDAVVLRGLVHHLQDPAHALREAARVARPGGTVLLVDKVGAEDIQARARRNAMERLRHSGHVWSWSERELRSLAESARLEVEAFEPWSEDGDVEEWIAGGDCPPPWDGIVRELLEADQASGGRILGTRRGPGGALLVAQSWGSLLLRKPEARR
jgi:ubiquinone/menaquinone biosynthesis C-methylase UbiE